MKTTFYSEQKPCTIEIVAKHINPQAHIYFK